MKISFLLIFLFFTQVVTANSIDSLKIDNDVILFLKRFPKIQEMLKTPTEFRFIPADSIRLMNICSNLPDAWEIKAWEKVDFNNDNNTDILVNIFYSSIFIPFVALDNGNGTYQLLLIRGLPNDDCKFAKTVKIKNLQGLVINKTTYQSGKGRLIEIDTLIYKFGDFIEYYNSTPKYKVNSVQLETSFCYGRCPKFTITVHNNGSLEYNAVKYVPKKGKFHSTLTIEQRDSIFQVFNYIDFKKLNDRYNFPITDMAKYWLRIKFSDGTSKEIEDYPGLGTIGLQKIYSYFFYLYEQQLWY